MWLPLTLERKDSASLVDFDQTLRRVHRELAVSALLRKTKLVTPRKWCLHLLLLLVPVAVATRQPHSRHLEQLLLLLAVAQACPVLWVTLPDEPTLNVASIHLQSP